MLTGVLLQEKHSSFKLLDLNKQTKSNAYMRLYLTKKKHPPENARPENKLIALISFIFVLLLTTCVLFSS